MDVSASGRRSAERRTAVALPLAVVLAAALSSCGDDDGRTLTSSEGQPSATPSADAATASPSPSPVESGATTPVEQDPAAAPTSVAPSATAPPAQPAEQPQPFDPEVDFDGDGRTDTVDLLAVQGMGWSFDVTLADGRTTSAPLPDDLAVAEDVAVLGAVDLDRDGRDEVLVRTLRAVGGENAVVFGLDGDGVWLVRTSQGTPWELSTSGGMSGPRSYDCTDVPAGPGREVRTRDSSREGTADAAPTYATTTRTWALRGHTAQLLAEQAATGVSADDVQLDPATCER